MNYSLIRKNDIANGLGIRVSLFVSGCKHHCKGCFQPETWDFNYGKKFTNSEVNTILDLLKPTYVNGLTLLGGEPLDLNNQPDVYSLLCEVKKEFPNKNVWCYTGYTYETDLCKNGIAYGKHTDKILEMIDILVDGKFIEEKKDISLAFRGSINQRLIDMKSTRRTNSVKLLKL